MPAGVMRSNRVIAFVFLSVTLGVVNACESATGPAMPADAVEMAAAKPYALWWSMVQSCSQRSGDLARVRWFVVPNSSEITVGARKYHGYWFGDDNSIVLASKSVLDGGLVRHEMLHALTGGGHARDYFVTRCGGVVACQGTCVEEAGLPEEPTAEAPVIDGSELELSLGIIPGSPSMTTDSGWFALEVIVKNPDTAAVWAQLRPVEQSTYATTFGYTIARSESKSHPFQTMHYFIKSARLGFGPKGARREIFDVQLPPGTYTITGTFNDSAFTAVDVTVKP